MTSLEQAVLSTLSWFDLWRQPLTGFECWYYLWDEAGSNKTCSASDVLKSLEGLQKNDLVKSELGFWQLSASPSYKAERLERARYSIAKRRRAQLAAKLLRALPFVRLVALANTLAIEGAKPESDIDLFIIIRHGRLYLGRLIVTALIQALGWRRHGQQVADRLCLSFYITDDQLNLRLLAYDDDPYLAYWLASLYPLGDSQVIENLLKANAWVKDLIPNRFKVLDFTNKNEQINSWFKKFMEKLLVGWFGDTLESAAKKLQHYLIHRHHHSRLGDGTTAVVVSDSVLKFHESDQRPELASAWRAKLHNLSI